ncbi:MAG TPA: hypothetical protein DDZ96_10130 [Porphyromonadaceae bacterium]|jgi:hypothetical protein|uniref:hypothetical protein n=1 Tax=Limibacterium fermenti TaxID=3229863 RepID=UPI000E8BAC36|nr:hypothetical protein [Porphyromonadaceae bacterium]HBK30655.1 hypothetical protein [Porphyromonadaceae bacterium]HBL34155.1 hypothetical protein [Porphyromonadaceae bacterium]HBX20450.1 hypothetical protein [Porphyromonadaceae bacterium]HBX46210.1 hypothetical protein [Porphyromonadaceae bacterium]
MNILHYIRSLFNPHKNAPASEKQKETRDVTFEKILLAKANGETLHFHIVKDGNSGFIVRIGNLQGFTSYKNMPWRYSSLEEWKAVSPYLAEVSFTGKLFSVNPARKSFIIDALPYERTSPALETNRVYTGIILNKSAKNIKVELGNNFNWEYGSLQGVIPFDTISGGSESLQNLRPGETRFVTFSSYNSPKRKKAIVTQAAVDIQSTPKDDSAPQPAAPPKKEKEKLTKEEIQSLKEYVGTAQPVTISAHPYNGRTYMLNERYRCLLENTEAFYGEKQNQVREYLRTKNIGDKIDCEVLAINEKTGLMTIRLNEQTVAGL